MQRSLVAFLFLVLAVLPASAQTPFFTGYLALGSVAGSFVELSAGGYARQPVTMTQSSAGTVVNTAGATFGPDSGTNWGTPTGYALYDAASGGNLIAWWARVSPAAMAVGATQTVQPGQIAITLAPGASASPQVWAPGTVIGTVGGQNVTAAAALVWASGAPVIDGAQALGAASAAARALIPSTHLHWAVLGDSFIQQASSGTDLTVSNLYATGVSLVDVLCGQCFSFDPQRDNFGTGGGTIATMQASMPALLARQPDVAVVQDGHNDCIATGPSCIATVEAGITSIVAQLRAARVTPVLVLDPPMDNQEGSAFVSVQQLRNLDLTINQWKRSFALANGVLTWDWNAALANLGDPNGGYCTGCSDDGVHANNFGGMLVAQRGMLDLKPLLGPPTTALQTNQNDTYDAIYNPLGNLLGDALFTGPYTGTFNGFANGSYPGAFSAYSGGIGTGKVLTSATPASPDGIGLAWQVSVSGTGTANNGNNEMFWLVPQNPFGASLTPGTVVEGWVKVTVASNSPFSVVMAKMNAGANSSFGNTWGYSAGGQSAPGFNGTFSPGFGGAWSGVIHIPPVVVPASGYNGVMMYLQAQFADPNGTFTGTVSFERPTFRVVP